MKTLEKYGVKHEIQLIVFRELVNWPQGFCDFLRVYLPRKPLEGSYFHPDVSGLDDLRMSR